MKFGVPRTVVVPEEVPLRRLSPRSPSTIHQASSSGGFCCIKIFLDALAMYRDYDYSFDTYSRFEISMRDHVLMHLEQSLKDLLSNDASMLFR
jgi:hypothetical protein